MNGEIILPPIETFTREENIKDQGHKVLEEAAELFCDINEGMYHHAVEEAMDTIQAICNLLEMLDVSDGEIEGNYKKVVQKNKARGYYDCN